MSLFSNREIATALWLLLAIAYYLSKGNVRVALLRSTKAFFHPEIQIGLGLMILYTFGVVSILRIANLWNLTLLKGTVIWFCFTATFLTLDILTKETSENTFAKVIKKNLKLIVIVSFIITTYTFSLVVELLIIPVATLLVLVVAVSETNEEKTSIANIASAGLIIIGLSYFSYAVYRAAIDYQQFLGVDSFKNLLLAPVLSVSLLPFIYVSVLVNFYFKIFRRLKSGPEKDKSLNRYAKRKIVLHCRLNVARTSVFLSANALGLMRIQNRDDVDRLLTLDSP